MAWRPPCTESAGLSRMPSRRTMAGKTVALAGILGRGTRAWGWSGVLGPGAVLLVNDNILYHAR